ncbi:ABC transporter ATP-binding protein [Streptosporangium sp. NPDC049644]|uniref:ABC transporter ATP-binding protein n=1 Tax=Streptosporangium sp. NPDC049644 TaxID=3155507 RepID=UPI0034134423
MTTTPSPTPRGRDPAKDRLDLDGVSVLFRTGSGRRHQQVTAVDEVDLTLRPGTITALVGESGSGKSTLGRVACGLQAPTSGTVSLGGAPTTGPGLGGAVQMIFQNPAASLNPKMTVGRILRYAARQAGVKRDLVHGVVEAALTEVGIDPPERYLGRHPHELSGGQQQRIAIARALLHRPRFLVADEPTSALDVSVRVQIIDLLHDVQARHGTGILFITHDLSVVRAIADRIAVVYLGRIVESGTADEVFARPAHPYTKALLGSTPSLTATGDAELLHGEPANAVERPTGCHFHPRCPIAESPRCVDDDPAPVVLDGTHTARCHLAGIPLAIADSNPVEARRNS